MKRFLYGSDNCTSARMVPIFSLRFDSAIPDLIAFVKADEGLYSKFLRGRRGFRTYYTVTLKRVVRHARQIGCHHRSDFEDRTDRSGKLAGMQSICHS